VIRRCLTWALAFIVAVLAGCSATESGHEIIVTTNIVGDVVRNVVGDTAPVRVLMKPNADPHSFALSAQDAAALSTASLIVSNGLGLEEGVARHVQTAADGGVPTLALGDRIDPIRYTQGDTAGAPDPHFWMDPRRMITAVDAIEETVNRELDGPDQTVVARNAERYREQLRALDAWMSQQFNQIPADRRKLVTNHHVLGYLADRFGLEVIGAIVPSGTTLAAPSSSDLQSLTTAIRSARVPAVFVDSSQPERLARVLAEEAGVRVRIVALYTESLSPPGTPGATYLDMMRANTDAIVNGLR
jgi:zinc/manganese transport system substrate-binding protein